MFERPDRDFRGFIFDCDGTLVDSMPLHHEAWRRALRHNGLTLDFTWKMFMERAGMGLEDTVAGLNAAHGCQLDPTRVADEERANFEELIHRLEPIPEVVEYARQVARDHPVSVASGNTVASVRRVLQATGLDDLFEIIVTPEHVEHGKPAPDMFLLAAERMGVAPEQCVVFEDSLVGIEAARNAGMAAVFVRSAEAHERRHGL